MSHTKCHHQLENWDIHAMPLNYESIPKSLGSLPRNLVQDQRRSDNPTIPNTYTTQPNIHTFLSELFVSVFAWVVEAGNTVQRVF
jgi:hypothetical protein